MTIVNVFWTLPDKTKQAIDYSRLSGYTKFCRLQDGRLMMSPIASQVSSESDKIEEKQAFEVNEFFSHFWAKSSTIDRFF